MTKIKRRSLLSGCLIAGFGWVWHLFLGSTVLNSEVPGGPPIAARTDDQNPLADAKALQRAGKRRPIKDSFDLVVVGGGLSGVCAAISAARNGVKTALVNDRPMLGGNSSSEVRLVPEFNNWFCPFAKETGIIEEFYAEDRQRDHEPWMEGMVNVLWDLVLLEAVKREENITLYLNTSVRDVQMRTRSRIDAIEAAQIGSEQDVHLTADLFVDATGLGSLGHFAGADSIWGREGRKAFDESFQPEEPDDRTMGSTMYFRARDVHRPVAFTPPEWAATFPTEESLGPMRSHPWPEAGYYWQEIGYPYHTIYDNEKIRQEQFRQVLGVWDHIKNRGKHGADNYALEWLSQWPYRRENRRLLGDYIMTQHDVQKSRLFDDRVAFGAWPIDIHPPGGMLNAPGPTVEGLAAAEGVNPYSIPYRSLYSRNIENLFMVGRPISCTWIAFASTRILPTGAMTGQAAGAAAALCKKHRVEPRDLTSAHIDELQQLLLKQDHYIPQVANQDPGDLARGSRVSASSEATLEFPQPNGAVDVRVPVAQLFPVSSDRIDSVELLVESTRNQASPLKLALRSAANIWDFSSEENVAVAEATVPARATTWVRFNLNARVSPQRLYFVALDAAKDIHWRCFTDLFDIHSFLQNRQGKDFWDIWKEIPPKTVGVPVGTMAALRWDLFVRGNYGGRRWNQLFSPLEVSASPTETRAPQSVRSSKALCTRVHPQPAPYSGGNVICGVSRPENWTNIWISDPRQQLPQWLELEFPQLQSFNSVYLTFDTDLTFSPEFPLHVPSECVKEYTVQCATGSGWQPLVEVTGNYQRRRIHRFERVRSKRLRLEVHATNGAPSARVYEIRVYDE